MTVEALPIGWTSHTDAEGRIFYANSTTGESSWTFPGNSANLPQGWSAHQDAEGRTFYANALTGESSWTCPTAAVEEVKPILQSLPEGWSEHQDAEGRTFYANISTGETSWTTPAGAPKTDLITNSHALILEERLMCGTFLQHMNEFAKNHARKFHDPSADGSGYSFELYSLFRMYETMLSAWCEDFLQSEGLSAEMVVRDMLNEEAQGKVFKSSEYLMAGINFECFVRLMQDFKTGRKDLSRWWAMCGVVGGVRKDKNVEFSPVFQ